jgi:hypothetical protein
MLGLLYTFLRISKVPIIKRLQFLAYESNKKVDNSQMATKYKLKIPKLLRRKIYANMGSL